MKSKLPSASQKGVALVIVLGLLVLILGLAIAFLTRTSIERSAAASYAATASTRQFADMAVNFVEGQIHNATSQGSSIAWASQPGMIRNFDTSGGLTRAYKLYSSDNLIATSTANLTTSDTPPATWATDTAVWSDLNAPVTADGVSNFPILDPGAIGKVDGFSINATSQPAGTSPTAIPMPVRWLYVLQDGTLAAASGTGSNATITGETTANPVVGRIAFWTDDETCKLNLNTASEGKTWLQPVTQSTSDGFATARIPLKDEYNRFPGHPASTCLSPVFDGLISPAPSSQWYIDKSPHVKWGGSENASKSTYNRTSPGAKGQRLYATVDEYIFDQNSRTSPSASLSRTILEQAKFFLTTSSKAPETTLFDSPRSQRPPAKPGA